MSVPAGSSRSPVEEALDAIRAGLFFTCDPISVVIGEGCGNCAGCEAYAALATVRERLERLTEERDEQVAVAEDIARACFDWKNRAESATAELQHTREGLRAWLDDVDDALSDGPGGHDAAIRIGARWDDHDAELRALLAVSSRSPGDTEPDGGGAK